MSAILSNSKSPQDVSVDALPTCVCGWQQYIHACSSGIGVETARALHATGADIYLTVRDMVKGEEVLQDIQKTSSGGGKLELLKLELDSLHSVKECAAEFLNRSSQLNVLACNAGPP